MLPWQPPMMFEQMTKHSFGVDRPAGADQWLPPATVAAGVAVAGEGMEHEHRVVSAVVQLPPGAIGERDRIEPAAISSSSGPISIEIGAPSRVARPVAACGGLAVTGTIAIGFRALLRVLGQSAPPL